ncbi:MAG: TonB-dependent receptor [Bacteroidetes bacterium QH_2_63_10]|nr:MAG: TonB-dependent receptor [Bacteroidetes bacterium QH_2_63_10]
MRLYRIFLLGACCLLGAASAQAQTWGTVTGTVTDSVNAAPLPGVTVLVRGTDFGTATDADGRYRLELPTGRYVLRFSAIGFSTHLDTVTVTEETTRLDVTLTSTVVEMEGVTVTEAEVPDRPGVYKVDPEDVQNIPTPFKDGFRALKTMPGVATNNELSQQYSVRGGGYNENLVFINGFEVFFPFRPRQGEQEGLGLLNPALASDVTFYTGGFPAKYGGKLSSALDVQYAQPDDQSLTGSVDVSTLDASVQAQSSALDGDLGWTFGMRRAQPGRFFGTQDLKGDYSPRFTDLQGLLTYRFSDRVSLEVLGIWADNTFELEPEKRTTYFGVISLDPDRPSDFKALRSTLTGARQDGYTTAFGGARLTTDVTDQLTLEHDVAYFGTRETENFDIESQQEVCQVDPTGPASPANCFLQGQSTVIRFANNAVEVRRRTGRGRYELELGRQVLKAGWHVRDLHFDDQLNEKTIIEGEDQDLNPVRIRVDSLRDRATFNEQQFGAYLQDAVDVLPTRNRLTVTGGVRVDYFSFNDEWTLSPRLSARFTANDRLTLTGSWGIYHQKPTYRELRGTPGGTQTIDETLNEDIKSQQSIQYVLGGEYFFPEQRLSLRAEAYYKDLNDLVSYTIEDVRVNYSGENDTDGYTYGFDLQLRGELVPGLDSWFNYSFLAARERFKDEALASYTDRLRENRQGLLSRPADQRHTFSAFLQDYVPGDKSWKVHMRLLYGSGLPYTPASPGPKVGNPGNEVRTRVRGERMSGRLPAYRRVDAGATKRIEVLRNGIGGPVNLELTLEVLNLFDMDNTVDYSWTEDFQRVPKRLTPRTLNARLRLTF